MGERVFSSQPASSSSPPQGAVAGAAAAVAAFGIWALFPVFFNQFGPAVTAWEILLHRMLWAAVFLLGFFLLSKRMNRLAALLRRPRAMLALAGSALAISTNWATFIYAVTHGEILQSSLGYYVTPLLNVLLGYCFLRERLQPLQRLAVAIAAAGVLLSLAAYGKVPLLALLMAITFSIYGLIRKQVAVDSLTGLMMETLLMLPIAISWLAVMQVQGSAVFLKAGLSLGLLLVAAGIITLLPLMFFAFAARRLRLATIGLLSYIAPTGHFLIGVFLYHEPFSAAEAVTFACIWTGLALYTVDMWLTHRRNLALK